MAEELLKLKKELERLKMSIKKQQYGLVWMDIPEAFEDDIETKLPILKEVPELAIKNSDGKPTHILIEGDNYHALTCLNYTHKGKIDVIYIDPPYNTGSDGFKYKDKRTINKFPDGTNVPVNHPFRHSYWLSFMRKRLELAKNLLAIDGVLFISIDDNEYPRLILLLEELFSSEKIKTICVKMSEATGVKMSQVIKSGGIPKLKEYLVIVKNDGIRNLFINKIKKEKWDSEYKNYIENLSRDAIEIIKEIRDDEERTKEDIKRVDKILCNIKWKTVSEVLKENKINKKEDIEKFLYDNSWRIFRTVATTESAKKIADIKRKTTRGNAFSIITPGEKVYFILRDYDPKVNQPRIKILFADDYLTSHPGDLWIDIKTTGLDSEGGVKFLNGKKPLSLLRRIISMKKYKDMMVILDFFAGSGTTAEAVMALNDENNLKMQCILCTNNEVDDEIKKKLEKNGYKPGDKEFEKEGICKKTCYPRMDNVLNGKNGVTKRGGSLKYYKTAFIGKNNILNATDSDKVELAHNAGELLAIAENTLELVKQNRHYQLFNDKNNGKYTAVYFREELDKFEEFVAMVSKLKKKTAVYVFSWGNEVFMDDFNHIKDVTIKTIPLPILEIYKNIYNLGA